MNETSSNSNKYGWVLTCDKTKYPEGHMNDKETLWTDPMTLCRFDDTHE